MINETIQIICADDDSARLNRMLSSLKSIDSTGDFIGLSSEETIERLKGNKTLIIVSELAMARKIRNADPEVPVIMLGSERALAYDAYQLHLQAFLLQDEDEAKLADEIRRVLSLDDAGLQDEKIIVKTFGEFDVLLSGRPISFCRSKAKELLAFLIDRQGGYVSRKMIFSILWEDVLYDRGMQKQLDVVIRSLRDDLRRYGIADILVMEKGMLRVQTEKLDCDLYRFFDGDQQIINSYRGEYMSSYSWASLTEAYMDRMQNRNVE